MRKSVIGVLHPGAMGASVIAALVANGHEVCWCDENRSPATRERAEAAGARRCSSMVEICQVCDVLLSICPPEFAPDMAALVRETGFSGLYLDANAIAPDEALALGRGFGSRYIDGGIIGPPAWHAGTTRLYLSGDRAAVIAELFAGSALEAIALEQGGAAASALKMCYAAWTKGNSALLLSVVALADALEVRETLQDEWARSQPGTLERAEKVAGAVAPKAWRFAGEMKEIASTYAAAELPAGFHSGAGEFYARLAEFKDRDGVRLVDLLAELETSSR